MIYRSCKFTFNVKSEEETKNKSFVSTGVITFVAKA